MHAIGICKQTMLTNNQYVLSKRCRITYAHQQLLNFSGECLHFEPTPKCTENFQVPLLRRFDINQK